MDSDQPVPFTMAQTFGVNFDSDPDLRSATRCHKDAIEDKPCEVLVLGKGTFTLEGVDSDSRLVVGGHGEHLA